MDWRSTTFREFLAGVAGGRAGRLLLTSPNHTFRIRALIEAFPGAAYVWAVRDPRQAFLSNCSSEPLPSALDAAVARLQQAQRRALASHGV